MIKHITLVAAVLGSFLSNSQISTAFLDINNAEARVTDGGVFFNDAANSFHGYEIPNGAGTTAFYSMGFWFAGIDANGQLKLSAQRYMNLADQFQGPLTTDGTAQADATGAWLTSLFPMSQSEIDQHLANYANAGYVPSFNIANWPAHGDIALGFDYYLAPFVDVNGDGNYDPMAGDYPCIRGDQAIFVIMNDKGDVHESGGDPIGIEMHYMFYQYTGIPEIENTTFINLKLINRGTQTLNDFKVSTFLDGDVGYYGDDYFGSDVNRNMMLFYNGDNLDETAGGSVGYGQAPPAVGIVSLANDYESIGIVDAQNMAPQYWSNMNARDASDMPWQDPITLSPTNYMFPGDPGNVSEMNSEVALVNPPGDRRGVATINLGTLVPFAEHTFDYAVIYHRDNVDNVDNASGLRGVADIVQDYFDTTFVGDCVADNTVSVDEILQADFSLFPNPSKGKFTISLANDFSNAHVEIHDISGRVVYNQSELTSKETHIQLNQPSGVYLLHLIFDGKRTTKRIILE
ncbi:MAG: T9SS type A sorting domain-containing protein [Crocinitomicaceae bacterium]|nr:T9SS type A sorting domain-containing protein [Crocinitomicaceae bacterium]